MPNGYDLNAVEGGIGRGLSRAADRLWELGKEKRAEKAKDKRYQTILGSYRTLLPDVPDEKLQAYVGSAMEGAQLPYSTLQQEKPPIDWKPLLKKRGISLDVYPVFEGLDARTGIYILKELAPEEEFNEDILDELVRQGVISQKDKMLAIASRELQKYYMPAGLIEETLKRDKAGSTKVEPLEGQQFLGIFEKMRGGVAFEDLDPEEKAALLSEFTVDKINALFQAEIAPDKIYGYGMNSINDKLSATFPLLDFPDKLAKWRRGTLNPTSYPTETAFFDKYYNKTTGDLKIEAAIEEGKAIFEKVRSAAKEAGASEKPSGTEKEGESIDFGGGIGGDAIMQLLQYSEESINWGAIEQAYPGVDIEKMKEVYRRLRREMSGGL